MICPNCHDGFVIVKMSVHQGSNDPREPYGPGLNVSYTCNVCEKYVKVDNNKYPANLDGLRKIVQKQLNAEGKSTYVIPNSSDDLQYGWRDGAN